MTPEPWTTADYALIVSLSSAAVSLLSLGWNVWSKFIYPKGQIEVGIGHYIEPTLSGEKKLGYVILSIVNHGPTDATAKLVIGRFWNWHSAITRRFQMAIMKHWGDKSSAVPPIKLPAKLAIGEEVRLVFPENVSWFEDKKRLQIGIVDTFGRNHWASRAKMKQLEKSLKGSAK